MTYQNVDLDRPEDGGGGINAPSLKLVLLLLLAIAVAVFFFQNGDGVDVEFISFDATWPLRSVIVISVIAGIVLDRLFTWQWRRARRKKAAEKLP